MARTGHSSTTGVRSYKRVSEQLIEDTSDVLNGKKMKVDNELVLANGTTSSTVDVTSPQCLNLDMCQFLS